MQSYIFGARQPVNAIMSEQGYTDVGTLSFSSAILSGQAVIVEIDGAPFASYLEWSDVHICQSVMRFSKAKEENEFTGRICSHAAAE